MEIKYRNVAKNGMRFEIKEVKGQRDYTELAQNVGDNDKRYQLYVDNNYAYSTKDAAEMIYYIIVNKVIDSAAFTEANKVQKRIKDALNDRLKERRIL